MSPTSALYMMCLWLLHSQANQQSWSQESYLDVEFTLSCNDSSVNLTGRGYETGVWTKLGYHGDLMTDDNYQLSDRNLSLVIKKVTNQMAGVYFCDVMDQNGENVGRVVRGLNILEHLYRDLLDKGRGYETGVWTKLGYHGDLMTDDNYQLSDRNLSLVIKKVTNQMAGVYFCDVMDQNGENVGRVVRGLNILEHLYRDLLDKYRTNIIRGIVTAASVVALVVGVCLIDRFQYQSGSQGQSSRGRADSHRTPLTQSPLGGPHSGPLEEDSGAYKPYGSLKVDDIGTQL